jgi:hypothetical protein
MNEDLEGKARALFERSVAGLDEAAVKRLRLARRATLASAAPAPRWQAWPAGLAAAGVLALGLAWWWPQHGTPAPAPVAATAATVDASADEPVLAEADDDADLYAFLADAPVAADAQEHRL